MTKNNETVLYEAGHRNGYNLNPLTSIYERASLVPAAAVIPALKMHRIIAAVKKLVVGSVLGTGSAFGCALSFPAFLLVFPLWPLPVAAGGWRVYLEEIKVLNTGDLLECGAWNNRKGFRFSFIGFTS